MEGPLSELKLDPTEIDKLFQKDPLELSDEEMDLIVEAERRQRGEFLTKEKTKGKGKSKPKRTISAEEASKKSLKDLNIDLSDIEI